MALITIPEPRTAPDAVKAGFEMFTQHFGTIPQPMRMLSISPKLFELQLQRGRYFARHPKLSFALVAHIRYLAACSLAYPYCTDFNAHLLQKLGYSREELDSLSGHPEQALLEEHETGMLLFVLKAMKKPAAITAEDVHALRQQGWEDRDMVDALAQGVSMIDHAIMMQAFQIEQTCTLP